MQIGFGLFILICLYLFFFICEVLCKFGFTKKKAQQRGKVGSGSGERRDDESRLITTTPSTRPAAEQLHMDRSLSDGRRVTTLKGWSPSPWTWDDSASGVVGQQWLNSRCWDFWLLVTPKNVFPLVACPRLAFGFLFYYYVCKIITGRKTYLCSAYW